MHGKNCVSIVSFEMTNKLEGSMSDIFYMMVGWSGRLTRMGNQKWQNVVVESSFSDWSSIPVVYCRDCCWALLFVLSMIC